jgi:putative autoinducer-2 (AI-2) aldolase
VSWGREHRLGRIFDERSGRVVMLAVDHGYFLGPSRGMERPAERLAPLLPYADALMATRGLLRSSVEARRVRSVVLRVSGGVSVTGPTLADEAITTSIEEALRIDASAVAVSVFVGTDHERATLGNLARAVDEGARYDMPVLGVTAMGKELGGQDARSMGLATRICAELGADIVKTYFTEAFESVTGSALVPVVIAGGKRLDAASDALRLAANAVATCAAGVDFGRNVWQSDHPEAMLRGLRAVVHDGASADEAMRVFERAISDPERPSPVWPVEEGSSG